MPLTDTRLTTSTQSPVLSCEPPAVSCATRNASQSSRLCWSLMTSCSIRGAEEGFRSSPRWSASAFLGAQRAGRFSLRQACSATRQPL